MYRLFLCLNLVCGFFFEAFMKIFLLSICTYSFFLTLCAVFFGIMCAFSFVKHVVEFLFLTLCADIFETMCAVLFFHHIYIFPFSFKMIVQCSFFSQSSPPFGGVRHIFLQVDPGPAGHNALHNRSKSGVCG